MTEKIVIIEIRVDYKINSVGASGFHIWGKK